jgi:hypothetical protein
MLSGLCTLVFAFLLGGFSAVAAGAEPAPGAPPLSSDLERLTLRQAEIFFGERGRELQLAQRSLNNSSAGVITAGERPHEESGRNSPEGG